MAACRRDLNAICVISTQERVDDVTTITAHHLAGFLRRLAQVATTWKTDPKLRQPVFVLLVVGTDSCFGKYDLNQSGCEFDPKTGQQLPDALSIDEITRLLDTPPIDSAQGLRDRAMMELLRATGARITGN